MDQTHISRNFRHKSTLNLFKIIIPKSFANSRWAFLIFFKQSLLSENIISRNFNELLNTIQRIW